MRSRIAGYFSIRAKKNRTRLCFAKRHYKVLRTGRNNLARILSRFVSYSLVIFQRMPRASSSSSADRRGFPISDPGVISPSVFSVKLHGNDRSEIYASHEAVWRLGSILQHFELCLRTRPRPRYNSICVRSNLFFVPPLSLCLGLCITVRGEPPR